jgi:hypothetical protein
VREVRSTFSSPICGCPRSTGSPLLDSSRGSRRRNGAVIVMDGVRCGGYRGRVVAEGARISYLLKPFKGAELDILRATRGSRRRALRREATSLRRAL